MFEDSLAFIRELYGEEGFIPLHEPVFPGNEKRYLNECIDSTFVSYIGEHVSGFEERLKKLSGRRYAVAMVNGTAALQLALIASGVQEGDEVITQPLCFVATSNAVEHAGADPVFVDVERDTWGMDPDRLEAYLEDHAERDAKGELRNKKTGKRIAACLPVHVFGHPCQIESLKKVCEDRGLSLVEDAAEAVGSQKNGQQVGGDGVSAIYSFNGNKVVTCGGGGAIVTDDEALAQRAHHLSTTAKKPGKAYYHDEIGYNFRLPNLNAAVANAQLENLESFVESKRRTAELYAAHFEKKGIPFLKEPEGTRSNYWLNTIVLESQEKRDRFLEEADHAGIMARPVWTLMHQLPIYKERERGPLPVAEDLAPRSLNIPSSVRL